MTEKQMADHIKALTKVIEKQAEYAEQFTKRFYNSERTISILGIRIARLEGINHDE